MKLELIDLFYLLKNGLKIQMQFELYLNLEDMVELLLIRILLSSLLVGYL
jgi:hypothetical protein